MLAVRGTELHNTQVFTDQDPYTKSMLLARMPTKAGGGDGGDASAVCRVSLGFRIGRGHRSHHTVTNPFQKYLIEFFSSHHAEHHHYVIILPLAVHACEACETEMGLPEEVVAGTG